MLMRPVSDYIPVKCSETKQVFGRSPSFRQLHYSHERYLLQAVPLFNMLPSFLSSSVYFLFFPLL
jgi:hypothetical protein